MVIPAHVAALMREYDIRWLSRLDEVPDAVIERVMGEGGLAEMRWLVRAVPETRLREYLRDRGRRVLRPRELRFWTWFLRIPAEEADGWTHAARRAEGAWRA